MIYNSPVGTLNIRAENGFLSKIIFSNETNLPQSENEENNKEVLEICRLQLDEYFAGERRTFDVPIHQDGTPFQQKIWTELMNIPYGKTISYLELSRRINNIKAIRAVGTANGRNNLPIIVPCHRVIGSDGSLTGYSGGVWIKKLLLDHENKFANGVELLF